VAAVIAFHYLKHRAPFTGGWLGVDLFFILSGFLITRLMVEEWRARGGLDLRAFYRRRAARLLPALYLLLAVVVVLSLTLSPFDGVRYDLKVVLGAIVYAQNWFWAVGHLNGVVTVTWSLSLEEQFYVAWALLFVVGYRRLGRRGLARALVAVIGVLYVEIALRATRGGDTTPLYTLPDGQGMVFLLVGCVLALQVPLDRLNGWKWVKPAAFFSFVLISPILATYYEGRLSFYKGLMLVVAAAMALIILAALQDGWFARALSLRVPVYIGRLSYGLYLWHVPVEFTVAKVLHEDIHAVAVVVVSTIATVGIAALSYRYVETPLRLRLGRRRVRSPGAVSATATWSAVAVEAPKS
jgi:peptidoglycan/LPS O-acetylase OafA/YrhL